MITVRENVFYALKNHQKSGFGWNVGQSLYQELAEHLVDTYRVLYNQIPDHIIGYIQEFYEGE